MSNRVREQHSEWLPLLRVTDPVPRQIVAMDQGMVLKLLKLITVSCLKRRHNIETRLGRWIWALLGRLEDVGCLTSEEVSVIRELGKRAVWVLAGKMQNPATGQAVDSEVPEYLQEDSLEAVDCDAEECTNNPPSILQTQEATRGTTEPMAGTPNGSSTYAEASEGLPIDLSMAPSSLQNHNGRKPQIHDCRSIGPNEGDGERATGEPALAPVTSTTLDHYEADVTEAKQHLLAQLSTTQVVEEGEAFPSSNTSATLDMIISIVGELYGQTDLLEFREKW